MGKLNKKNVSSCASCHYLTICAVTCLYTFCFHKVSKCLLEGSLAESGLVPKINIEENSMGLGSDAWVSTFFLVFFCDLYDKGAEFKMKIRAVDLCLIHEG